MTANELIRRLRLEPHPEGGWYRRTWVAPAGKGQRGTGSAIYYLLTDGQNSRRHRVDATEIWHHYRGAPVELRVGGDGTPVEVHLLGSEVEHGQAPQVTVPAGVWQEARCLGEFSLVGCTVSPAFEIDGFELDDGSHR